MTLCRPCPLIFLVLLVANNSAYGGSIRYELTSLLGEYRYDRPNSLAVKISQVQTQLGFADATEARLVVQGQVTPGKAHGDGMLRENTEFDLLPYVSAYPSFSSRAEISMQPTPESFTLEQVYLNPFFPLTTPLPNPDGNPPVSFFVSLNVGPVFGTLYPPLINPPTPGELIFVNDGVIVDVPILANITSAYIVLSGPTIVPEPHSLAAMFIAFSLLLSTNYRLTI